ncbi:hypothetical protein NUSPORA_01704 [Nucleospora cyclopteri]
MKFYSLSSKNHNYEKYFLYRKVLNGHEDSVYAMEISPKGSYLATGGEDRKIMLTDCYNFTKEFIETPHTESLTGVKIENEFTLISTGSDGQTNIYDLNSNSCVRSYLTSGYNYKVDCDFNSNLIGVSNSNSLVFYDKLIPTHRSVVKIKLESSTAARMEFRPNYYTATNFIIANNDTDGTHLDLYDLRNYKKPLFSYSVSNISHFGISDAVFDSNGHHILVTAHCGGPYLYSVKRSKLKMKFEVAHFRNLVTYKSFKFGGPDDSYVLGGFDDKKVCYWKIKNNDKWERLYNKEKIPKSPLDRIEEMDANLSEENQQKEYNYSYTMCSVHLSKLSKFYLNNTKHMQLNGFRSVVNRAVMHPTIPRIFAGGVENALYAFSPFDMGNNEDVVYNEETIDIIEEIAKEAYENYKKIDRYYMLN